MGKYYAHSLPGVPEEEWQLLLDHLKNTAEIAESYTERFGAHCWGYLAGILHDIGKYSTEFQRRICGENLRVDHSTAGARESKSNFGVAGLLAAYCIAGHHTGLPDGGPDSREGTLS